MPIELGGKTIFVEVEVVDAPIDYNLILGNTCLYEMKKVESSVFFFMSFPHQGKIVNINYLYYYTPYLRSNASTNVSFFDDSPRGYARISMGLFEDSLLLDTFPLPIPKASQVAPINMISFVGHSFCSYGLWVIPNPLEVNSFGASMSLSPAKLSYFETQ